MKNDYYNAFMDTNQKKYAIFLILNKWNDMIRTVDQETKAT